jgi:GNAT superfamily N-acetyltransferase
MPVRPMRVGDLPAVLELQHRAYPPALHDSAAAFESRMRLAPEMNLVHEIDGVLAAYLVSHPWSRRAPPPVDTVLKAVPAADRCWFVHDLTVSPDHRGRGLARTIVAAGRRAATSEGLLLAELIAVAGAAPFWRRVGFASVVAEPALAAKVAGYGPEAIYMQRDV